MELTPEIRLRDEQWCIALLNTLPLDQVSAVLKAFNAGRGPEQNAQLPEAFELTREVDSPGTVSWGDKREKA